MPSSINLFPSPKDFPREAPSNMGWNCLMFALGITTPVRKFSGKYFLDSNFNVGDSFLRKVDNLKLEFNSTSFQRISTPMESDSNIFFLVYGFKEVITSYIFGFPVYKQDFHVMRGIRYDSATVEIRWEHKPGWEQSPHEVTSEEWDLYEKEFANSVLFAFNPI